MRETTDHIHAVQMYLSRFISQLAHRMIIHDQSKLHEPEFSCFAEVTEQLNGLTYGSEEYYEKLKELKPALDHHYSQCPHHPEHHKNGIEDMTLIDLLEMVCDWKAATARHADGCIQKSLEINKERFGIDDQLYKILCNTAYHYPLMDFKEIKGELEDGE
jgi:hypothetical protein